MSKPYGALALCLAAVLALSGCARGGVPGGMSSPPSRPGGAGEPEGAASTAEPSGAGGAEGTAAATATVGTGQTYVDRAVQETIALFAQPDMDEFQRAKAAFDYLIETTTLIDPVGLDIWRIRGEGDPQPGFVENRSLSVLLFRMGKCEDYAAALTMLLRGLGLEAEYVPGLTYSSQGALVDHAWTVAKIDGEWYHLDCQLEQNISRHGDIRYKYFMRGDATMAGSHRWGQNLINAGLLTGEQNREIAEGHIPPACPQDYPTPSRRSFKAAPAPDPEATLAAIEAERRQYEAENGSLAPLELNTIPPVFALEGYGPQD